MESENPGDSKSPGILILWERDDGGFAIYVYIYIYFCQVARHRVEKHGRGSLERPTAVNIDSDSRQRIRVLFAPSLPSMKTYAKVSEINRV